MFRIRNGFHIPDRNVPLVERAENAQQKSAGTTNVFLILRIHWKNVLEKSANLVLKITIVPLVNAGIINVCMTTWNPRISVSSLSANGVSRMDNVQLDTAIVEGA